MKLLSSKMIMTLIMHKKNYIILSKCDNVIENFQIHMSRQLFFFGLKICTNVKNKFEKGIFEFFFEKKKHWI
jgi:hypothetical protein